MKKKFAAALLAMLAGAPAHAERVAGHYTNRQILWGRRVA